MVVAEATRTVVTRKAKVKEETSLEPTSLNKAKDRIENRIRRNLHNSNLKHQRSLSLKIN